MYQFCLFLPNLYICVYVACLDNALFRVDMCLVAIIIIIIIIIIILSLLFSWGGVLRFGLEGVILLESQIKDHFGRKR